MKTKKNTKSKIEVQPCGLCGKKNKTCQKIECCGNWVCGNENDYVMFSYSRDICCRNHRRFTLCGYHHTEGHRGDWQKCKECLSSFEPEICAWYGTNEYNFEKLSNPPKFKPTHCANCDVVISLSEGGYTSFGDKYACEKCMLKGYDLRK
jgi:hypothetical protein